MLILRNGVGVSSNRFVKGIETAANSLAIIMAGFMPSIVNYFRVYVRVAGFMPSMRINGFVPSIIRWLYLLRDRLRRVLYRISRTGTALRISHVIDSDTVGSGEAGGRGFVHAITKWMATGQSIFTAHRVGNSSSTAVPVTFPGNSLGSRVQGLGIHSLETV